MENTPAVRMAHEHIENHWTEDLARVQAFLRQPSVSAQNEGVRAAADMLRAWLEEQGAVVEYHGDSNMPILFAEWQVGAPRTLLMYGMYDVQPVDDQVWSSPPFAAEIHDHPRGGPSVIARGACNSKGPLIAALNAIAAMRAAGGLPVNVKWAIEGAEEIGSPGLPVFYEQNRERLHADAAYEPFWSQSVQGETPIVTLGTKGVVGIDFICRSGEWGGPLQTRHSSEGAWLASPAWRLVQALASLVNTHQELAIDGIPALGPLDQDDEGLLRELAEDFDHEYVLKMTGARAFKRPGLTPFELLRQYQFAPALNINGLVSGYAGPGSHTIIPTEARALTDLRIPVGLSVAEVLAALRRHLDARGFADIAMEVGPGYPGARTAYSAPVVQALLRAYAAHGYDPVVRPIEPSATPYYLFTDVLGLDFTWGGLGAAAGSHGPDEWASVAGLKDLEMFVVTFFHAFAEGA